MDKRADIWAFGCVLYEMFTGCRAFAGDEVSDTLAFILTKDPVWAALPPGTPTAIRTLLRRCLDKDPRRRLRDIGEARVLLSEPPGVEADPVTSSVMSAPVVVASFRRWLWPLAAACLGAAISAGLAVWLLRADPLPSRAVRFSIVPGETPFFERNASLSPDGRWMAYDSNESGRFETYVRPFPEVAAGLWQISGEGGAGPIWARSGRELFYDAGDLSMMSVSVKNDSGFVASVPTRLFDASSYHYSNAGPGGTYDISLDGRRFIMVKAIPDPEPQSQARLLVTTQWVEEIQSRLPKP